MRSHERMRWSTACIAVALTGCQGQVPASPGNRTAARGTAVESRSVSGLELWTPTSSGDATLHNVRTLAMNGDSGLLPYSAQRWFSAYSGSVTEWEAYRPVREHGVTAMFQLERSADGRHLMTDTMTIDLVTGEANPILDLAGSSLATKELRLQSVLADPDLQQAVVQFGGGLADPSDWYIVDLESGATVLTLPVSKDRGPAPIVAWGTDTVAIGRYPDAAEVTILRRTDLKPMATIELPTYASVLAIDESRERLAVSDPNGVIVIAAMKDGAEVARLRRPESAYAMSFHPRLDLLAVSGGGGVSVLTIEARSKVIASTPNSAERLAFDPQGRLFASSRTISVYELVAGEPAEPMPPVAPTQLESWRPTEHDPKLARSFPLRERDTLPAYATLLTVAANGEVLTSEGSEVRMWEAGVPTRSYSLQSRSVVRLSDDNLLYGDYEAVALGDGRRDASRTEWLHAPRRAARSLKTEAAHVAPNAEEAVIIAKWIPPACGGCNEEMRAPRGAGDWTLVRRSDGSQLAAGKGAPLQMNRVAWTKRRVAIASTVGDVEVRARADGRLLATLAVAPPALVEPRGEDLLTVGADGRVERWEFANDEAETWKRHDEGVLADYYDGANVAFHPVEPLLAVANGREIGVFRYRGGLARVATTTVEGSPLAMTFGPGRSLWVSTGHHAGQPPRVLQFVMGD